MLLAAGAHCRLPIWEPAAPCFWFSWTDHASTMMTTHAVCRSADFTLTPASFPIQCLPRAWPGRGFAAASRSKASKAMGMGEGTGVDSSKEVSGAAAAAAAAAITTTHSGSIMPGGKEERAGAAGGNELEARVEAQVRGQESASASEHGGRQGACCVRVRCWAH